MVQKELGELAWQRQLLLALVLQLVAAVLLSSLLLSLAGVGCPNHTAALAVVRLVASLQMVDCSAALLQQSLVA